MAENFKAKLDDREWRRFFREILSKMKNRANILKTAFSIYGIRDIVDHFDKERGPKGKWKKRSPITQMQYARLNKKHKKYNPSNKLLQLTGALRQSILPSNVKKISKDEILVFSNVEYSAMHDLGSRKRNLPQREFMWLSKPAISRIQKTIMRIVAEGGYGV